MVVTFITTEVPSLRKGAPVRTYNLIKQAIAYGATVDLITIVESEEGADYLKNELGVNKIIGIPKKKVPFFVHFIGAIFNRIPPYFTDNRLSDMSDKVLSYAKTANPDIIQLELLHSYDAISKIILKLKGLGIKVILNAHNVEYNSFTESISTFSRLKYLIGRHIAPHLLSIEITAAREVDHIFTCSEADKYFFSKITSKEKVTVVPNGVDCSQFVVEPLVSEHSLIFTGGMYYPPNDDALRFYFNSIYPLVKKEVPDVKITLLGGEPNPWLRNLAKKDSNIIMPGLVPDVRSYIYNSRICISPMLKGSGTSLKILEYMGSGKPIVSTPVGVRGISCENEKEALIADDPKIFADSIVHLLHDDELATNLGRNARMTAEALYDWNIIGKKMFEIYRNEK